MLEKGPPKPHFSHWWYDLRSINQHRSMAEVSKQFIWKLGIGVQILLWENSWVDGGITLKEKYLQLYRISLRRLQTVADLGSFCESGWEWKFSWRQNLFDNEMGIASAFIDYTAAINLNDRFKDTWVWGAACNGIFSTKSYASVVGIQLLG